MCCNFLQCLVFHPNLLNGHLKAIDLEPSKCSSRFVVNSIFVDRENWILGFVKPTRGSQLPESFSKPQVVNVCRNPIYLSEFQLVEYLPPFLSCHQMFAAVKGPRCVCNVCIFNHKHESWVLQPSVLINTLTFQHMCHFLLFICSISDRIWKLFGPEDLKYCGILEVQEFSIILWNSW